MIKILLLTSSRADFGIYLPLIKSVSTDNAFELDLCVFGTHLSKFHGYTLDDITRLGVPVKYEINNMVIGDKAEDIATAYGLTALKFSDFWKSISGQYKFTIVLGDRFEMAAAVAAGIPFNIQFVHIHGGETTLGAIDNVYRHSISLASKIHFVALPSFKQKLKGLLGDDDHCHVVGALSLDNLKEIDLLSVEGFYEKWKIDLTIPTLLFTVHPETIDFDSNKCTIALLESLIVKLKDDYQIIITMPNADTVGTLYREMFNKLASQDKSKIKLIENFGTQSYFTCMKHAILMVGNTSSGIIEAASFQKFVINLGSRQKGRESGENVIHVPYNEQLIFEKINEFAGKKFSGRNIYDLGGATDIIKKWLTEYVQ
ncbi:UDP-N-acetylglucosamine 2-epimerase [Lunatibacter salilacus]|uniref:UDP-N-acetylglucosamine 2-epimerase n=1 Tax=Lunatibacter salilacus TaxID=2483804 RepID=UPI00131A6106|nr:UDP-N-acetylglucosamine 2-epimerase [Lunatibacter salilacus]